MNPLKPAVVFWVPLGVALWIIFYPLIWGRVPSPNDIYLNYDPWREGSFEKFASNSTLNDPATGYWTKAALFRSEPSTFLWNPYLACGVPGHADLFSGMLNPFALLPALISIKGWYALMLLFKILAAYAGMYLCVRAWGMGPAAGASAGLAWTFFGQNLVYLWWPQTNAAVLFPWLLLLPVLRNRRYFFALSCVLCLSMLGSGYPAYVFDFAYLFLAYLLAVHRRDFLPFMKKSAAPVLLCLLIALPFLWITFQDLKSTSRMEERATAAREKPVPLRQLTLFAAPDHYGPAKGFEGVPGFPAPNNYHASAVYLGIPSLLLVALGCAGWRETRNRFFILTAGILFFLLYIPSPLRTFVGRLPGVSSSPFHRLFILLGIALCVLAAYGMERLAGALRNPKWALAVPLVLALDLGFHAAAFLPYQKWGDVAPRKTDGLRFLEKAMGKTPYRVAPVYDALWPNSAEWTRIADVRSHFISEGWYRAGMEAVESGSTHRLGTLITFWDARTVFHPWFSALGVKYVAEPPMIHTVENEIAGRTVNETASGGGLLPFFGVKRSYAFLGTPYRIGFHARADREAAVQVTLRDDFSKIDLQSSPVTIPGGKPMAAYWVDVRDPRSLSYARTEIEIRNPASVPLEVGVKEPGVPALAVDYSHLQPVYAGGDLTLFENRALSTPFALYYHATAEPPATLERMQARAMVESGTLEQVTAFLKDTGLNKNGRVAVKRITHSSADLEVSTNAPALLAFPFKYNPLWQEVAVDGAVVRALKVNGGMNGLLLSPGTHQVSIVYGRKFIPFFLGSLLLLLAAVIIAITLWAARSGEDGL